MLWFSLHVHSCSLPVPPSSLIHSGISLPEKVSTWSMSEGACGVSVGEAVALLVPEDWTPLGGLLRWYSSSSTVHTAPLTFSTRMKHLCSDRLCRTAFWKGDGEIQGRGEIGLSSEHFHWQHT